MESKLETTVKRLLDHPDLDSLFEQSPGFREELRSAARMVAAAAFIRREPRALRDAHATLAHLYRQNFHTPASGRQIANQFSPPLLEVRLSLESSWERYERSRCGDWNGIRPEQFTAVFLDLVGKHRVICHPLGNFLAEKADRAGVSRFIALDGALALDFFDIIAMTLLGTDDQRVKSEVVSILNDEVTDRGQHTVLIHKTLSSVGAPQDPIKLASRLGWRALAGINLFYLLCINRRLRNEHIGAMGVTDYVDPQHHAKVIRGCRRVGLDAPDTVAVYSTHAEPEKHHRSKWLENVMLPTVERDSAAAVLTGVEMRLNTCADYYDETLDRLLADDTSQ
ncbi:hypothetical protein ABIE67_007922 [Streptomyces sp. V4I8]|uniref:iron-containing redox enzyme family protein n=1 Tax=Streptomyces sp. V4I8 TaxID=3156469 RepID=UPI00351567F5